MPSRFLASVFSEMTSGARNPAKPGEDGSRDSLAAGPTGWLGAIASQHTRDLVAIARGEGLSGEDAIDAVQEAFGTFLRLPQAQRLSSEPEEARILLGTVVKNAARNLRRRHHRSKPHVELDETASQDAPSPEQVLEHVAARGRLYGCIEELEDAHKHELTLRMLEELSGVEVAARLGINPGHVAVLLHRAKKALHRCIVR